MEKIYTTPVRNFIQRNGFVMVSNLLLDFQQELNITDGELLFLIKIMRNKNGYSIHDRDLDPTVCSKTLSRKRNSLKEKGLLNFTTIKSQDLETKTFKTDGISYDLSPLEEKLQLISDKIEKEREKKITKQLEKKEKIVEDTENSPLENYLNDYQSYYGTKYIVSDYELKKYNTLSEKEKKSIAYIFNYCSDNNLLGKIVPRLSLFFKAKFRFEELLKYYEEINDTKEKTVEEILKTAKEKVDTIYRTYLGTNKENYPFYKAIERIVLRYADEEGNIPPGLEKLFEKAFEDNVRS